MKADRLSMATSRKREAYFAMESISKGGPLARTAGRVLLALILINAFLVFAHAQPGLPDSVYGSFLILEAVSTVCFGVEYAVRIWVADIIYPEKTPMRARIRYMLSLMGIVDFLAFAPGVAAIFLPAISVAANSLRIIRLVRFVKISRYMVGLQSISQVISRRRHEVIAAFMVLALLTITASVLMFTVENPAQPQVFDSLFTGMYWAVTTITSTGYGDIVPITPIGRFIGTVTMILSIAVVAIPAGIFSAGFVSEFRDEKKRENTLARMKKSANQANHEESSPEKETSPTSDQAAAVGDGDFILDKDARR